MSKTTLAQWLIDHTGPEDCEKCPKKEKCDTSWQYECSELLLEWVEEEMEKDD